MAEPRPCIAPGCVLAAVDGDVYCEGHESVRNDVFDFADEHDEIDEEIVDEMREAEEAEMNGDGEDETCWACHEHIVDCSCAEYAERDSEMGFFQEEY